MGVFGRVTDALCRIFKFKKIEDFLKWVDDFIFFRYPTVSSPTGPWSYTYSEKLIWDIGEELGWPWAPKKHFPFASSFTYIGFHWDIKGKSVSLPESKRVKYLDRLEGWVRNGLKSCKDADILVGTLNHCTLVVPQGRSHLPAFYAFLATFKSSSNRNIKHTINASLALEAAWWRSTLANPWCGIKIRSPPPPLPIEVFVDASSSWGIGFIMDQKWLAFPLIHGWKCDKRDIGWAEMVAVELALRAVINAGFHDCHFILRSDNSGVVGALKADMSRNSQQNAILRQILQLFHSFNIWLTVVWIPTKENPADAPSRGSFGTKNDMFPFPPAIPVHLSPYVRAPISARELP